MWWGFLEAAKLGFVESGKSLAAAVGVTGAKTAACVGWGVAGVSPPDQCVFWITTAFFLGIILGACLAICGCAGIFAVGRFFWNRLDKKLQRRTRSKNLRALPAPESGTDSSEGDEIDDTGRSFSPRRRKSS